MPKKIVTEYYWVSDKDVYFVCGPSAKERAHATEHYPNHTQNFLPYHKAFLDYCKTVVVTEKTVEE